MAARDWFKPSVFHELVSGRRRGPSAALLRAALGTVAVPYGWAVRYRNWRYDHERSESHGLPVPIVSVGNVTLGGVGKTPMVEWLARWFRERGLRVAIVSRGYGAEAGQRNDEALELELRLPDVPHLQDVDRVAAASTAVDELQCQAIVLDDGFQHRRLRRDLDIVLLDAMQPFGFGRLFPRGLLREPLTALRRAQAIVLSRADAVSPAERDAIRQQAQRYAPDAVWLEAEHRPQCLVDADGRETPLASLRGQAVAAFCGIGNPAAFRHTLEQLGCRVAGFREFEDHHAYQRDDVQELVRFAEQSQAALLVCTQKDLVKLRAERLGDFPLRAVQIGLAITAGRDLLEQLLEPLAARAAESTEF